MTIQGEDNPMYDEPPTDDLRAAIPDSVLEEYYSEQVSGPIPIEGDAAGTSSEVELPEGKVPGPELDELKGLIEGEAGVDSHVAEYDDESEYDPDFDPLEHQELSNNNSTDVGTSDPNTPVDEGNVVGDAGAPGAPEPAVADRPMAEDPGDVEGNDAGPQPSNVNVNSPLPTTYLLMAGLGAALKGGVASAVGLFQSKQPAIPDADLGAVEQIATRWREGQLNQSIAALDSSVESYDQALTRLKDTDWFNKATMLSDAINAGDASEVNRLAPLVSQAAQSEVTKAAMADFQQFSSELVNNASRVAQDIDESPDPAQFREVLNDKIASISNRTQGDLSSIEKLGDNDTAEGIKDVIANISKALAGLFGARNSGPSPSP